VTIYVNARAIIERETESGTEILLQIRSRTGEPERWELPGGQIDPFEPVVRALEREILEETGLTLTLVENQDARRVHENDDATVETFEPFFAYQTLRGPVDSLGFYFRCQVSGELVKSGDAAKEPSWFSVDKIERLMNENRDCFDWLTQAAIERYMNWRQEF
jgi:8-oxo-dGTP pyrophosphatase MutT (NUDIX family)